jgi:hypothetical protein
MHKNVLKKLSTTTYKNIIGNMSRGSFEHGT